MQVGGLFTDSGDAEEEGARAIPIEPWVPTHPSPSRGILSGAFPSFSSGLLTHPKWELTWQVLQHVGLSHLLHQYEWQWCSEAVRFSAVFFHCLNVSVPASVPRIWDPG